MAANSVYQLIRTQHVNNVPPNAYPQTDFETFKQYQIRMASQGLPVDIAAAESDADYETRLASYAGPVPFENISSSFALVSQTEIGTVTQAASASYVLGSGVSGTVALAKTGSYVTASNLAGGVAFTTIVGTDSATGNPVTMSFNHGVLVTIA
jgi:hypothetical protein